MKKAFTLLLIFLVTWGAIGQSKANYRRYGKLTTTQINNIDVTRTDVIYTAYDTTLGYEVINKSDGSGWVRRFEPGSGNSLFSFNDSGSGNFQAYSGIDNTGTWGFENFIDFGSGGTGIFWKGNGFAADEGFARVLLGSDDSGQTAPQEEFRFDFAYDSDNDVARKKDVDATIAGVNGTPGNNSVGTLQVIDGALQYVDLENQTDPDWSNANEGDYIRIGASGGFEYSGVTGEQEPYGPSWNGSADAPTKDDIYDHIETINASLTAEQIERIGNIGAKHTVTISADVTLTNENFAPTVTPNRGKTTLNITTGDYTLTIPNSVTSESVGSFKPTDIDATLTFLPADGVTFVGNGTSPITQGFQIDSLNLATVLKIGDNLFSVDGAVKPYQTSYAFNNLYEEQSGVNADDYSAVSIGSFTEQNGVSTGNISNSTEHPNVQGGAPGSIRFEQADDGSYNGLYLDFADVNIDLTVDDSYTLECWVRKDSSTGSLRLRIDQTTDADINPTLTIGEWTKLSITWTADVVNPTLRLVPGWNFNTGSDDLYMTNLVIIQN
ncbi:MAG: hypothetical protein AAF717_00385 [Bacteroidota bacterium]